MLVRAFFLFLLTGFSLQSSQNICDQCKINIGELISFVNKDDAILDDFAEKICFSQTECTTNIGKFLKNAKQTYNARQPRPTPTEACATMHLCSPPPPAKQDDSIMLSAKLNNALLSILNKLATLVQTWRSQWKARFCDSCSNELQPLTQFFIENEMELEDKVKKICSSVTNIGLPIQGCQSFLESLIDKAKSQQSPFCAYICPPSGVGQKSTINEQKLQEIGDEEKRNELETIEKSAEVKEDIETKQQVFDVKSSGDQDGDVNAFCTLCLTFTSKLPKFQTNITEAITDLVAELLFDDTTLANAKDELLVSVNKTVGKFVGKYENNEICKNAHIKACSELTYTKALEAIKNEGSTKKIGCNSCQSFTAYLAPILAKESTKKDLTNYFYKEVTAIFSVQLLDHFGLNVYDAISHAVENLSIFMNQSGTCSKSDMCEAP